MKKLVLITLCCLVFVAGCGNAKENNETQLQTSSENVTVANNEAKENETEINNINIINFDVVESNGIQLIDSYIQSSTLGDWTVSNIFLIVKNTTQNTVSIDAKLYGCDSSKNHVCSADGKVFTLGANETTYLYTYVSTQKSFNGFEVSFKTGTSEKTSQISNIVCNAEKTNSGAKAIVKNTSNEDVEYVEVCILYFKNGKVVDYTLEVIETNNSAVIKANSTVEQEFEVFEDFDSIKCYFMSSK